MNESKINNSTPVELAEPAVQAAEPATATTAEPAVQAEPAATVESVDCPQKQLAEEIKLTKEWEYKEFTNKFHALLVDSSFIQFNQKRELPNIFNIVGQTRKELCHSFFIAWLLNPRGSHNLGVFSLKNLLCKMYELAKDKSKELLPNPDQIEFGNFENIIIRPECSGRKVLGERAVYFEKYKQWCNFDIALSSEIRIKNERLHRLIFICENKVDSPEGKSKDKKKMQTEMYEDFWGRGKDTKAFFPLDAGDSKKNPLYTKAVVSHLALLFLSAKGVEAKSERFVNMTYKDFYQAVLLPAFKHPDLSVSGKKLIQEYIDLLNLQDIIISEDSKKLIRNIFQNHHEIFEAYLDFKLFNYLFPDTIPEFNTKPSYDQKLKIKQILGWLKTYTNVSSFAVHQSKVKYAHLESFQFKDPDGWSYSPQFNIFGFPISITVNSMKQIEEIRQSDPSAAQAKFLSVWNSFAAGFREDKNNADILRYIDCIDNSYPDVCETLMSLYRDFCTENKNKDCNQNCDLYCDIIDTLSSAYAARDYSYLKDYLNQEIEGDSKYTYPIVYFKDDKDKKYPIYINLENNIYPQFAFAPTKEASGNQTSADSEAASPCQNGAAEQIDWVSGNKICQCAAEKLGDPDGKNKNYQWFANLRYVKNGNLSKLPDDPSADD